LNKSFTLLSLILAQANGFAPLSLSPSPVNGILISSPRNKATELGVVTELAFGAAVKALAGQAAKEKAKEIIGEKVKEKVKERVVERVKNRVKAAAKKRALAFARNKAEDLSVDYFLDKIDGLSDESRELLDPMDPYTALVTWKIPPNLVEVNKDGKTYKDVESEDFGLGWTQTGRRFHNWEKSFVPATTYEVTDELSIRRIKEDDFFGTDEAFVDKNGVLQSFLQSSKVFPIEDVPVEFNSTEQAIQLLEDIQLAPPVKGREYNQTQASPEIYSDWGDDISSDETFSRFFFHGIGATVLTEQTIPSDDIELGSIVVDMPVHELEVRDGFRPLGAKVYFSAEQELTAIFDYHHDTLVKPGDDAWESTKFLARSTAFTMTTAQNHLMGAHLTVANALTLATIKRLPPYHPIRRLVTIFTFRTNKVNDEAFDLLIPERSLFHRTTGFTYDAIRKIFEDGSEACSLFEPFDKKALSPELQKLSDEGMFPYHSEGLEYYNIVKTFVGKWLDQAEDYAHDEDARAFYEEIQAVSMETKYKLPDFDTEDALLDVLTQSIWICTYYHEIVGTLIDYTSDPSFVGARVVDGATKTDVQSFVMTMMITAGTSVKVPMLMKPFNKFFSKHGAPCWERRRWKSFIRDLKAQSKDVKRADKKRDFEYKFGDPERFECSLSV
jgi:hypothetical protein